MNQARRAGTLAAIAFSVALLAAGACAQDRWQPAAEGRHTDAALAARLTQSLARAGTGDATAMFDVAEACWLGDGTFPDARQAVEWFQKSAAGGNAEAMSRLGDAHQLGVGVAQDFSTAMQWYRRAAEAGSTTAMAGVGWMYWNGLGVEPDVGEALRWYRRAAEAGGAEGMNNLGYAYRTGSGVDRSPATAVEWFERAAEQGNAWAMDNLGEMHLFGESGEADVERAMTWFERAVAAGHAISGVKMAEITMGRHGHATDYERARRWAQAAAELGDTEGMRHLATMELNGFGGRADVIAALTWYSRSANRGNQQAAVDAAWVYFRGSGTVRRNAEQAMMILNQSSAAGNPLAMRALGDVYAAGTLGVKDRTAAAQWYTRAAEAGDTESLISLARLLMETDGDASDFELAKKLIQDAAERGSARAAELAASLWGAEAAAAPPPGDSRPAAPHLTAPDAWKAAANDPFSAVRLTAADDAVLITVTALPWQPAQLVAHITRWRFQLGLDPIDDDTTRALLRPVTVDGIAGSRVDMSSPESAVNRRRTVGVIVPRGDHAWFVKMIGPVEAVSGEAERFEQFLGSIRFLPH